MQLNFIDQYDQLITHFVNSYLQQIFIEQGCCSIVLFKKVSHVRNFMYQKVLMVCNLYINYNK